MVAKGAFYYLGFTYKLKRGLLDSIQPTHEDEAKDNYKEIL